MNEIISIPIGYVLGIIGTLAGVIATITVTFYQSLNSRLAAQDNIISGLRADIDRMSVGCGVAECRWRKR
jgi:hypothetical protein